MKKIFTLIFSLFICFGSIHAQTILYSQNFNTGTASDWTLNTTDLGGDASLTKNQWIINNSYAGDGLLFATTPDEISPITGAPESYYLHITSALNISSGYPNDCYQTGAAGSYIAVMNAPIVTTGHTNDTLSFWWICKGSLSSSTASGSAGKVYYRTSATDAWQQITSAFCTDPISIYNANGTTWKRQKVHIDSFDNAPFLEFAFQFTRSASGSDPAFGVDDITVYTPTVAATPPVTSFTTSGTTTCEDSCITFTSTTTGVVDSVRWTTTGGTIASPTSNSTNICFPAAGTFTVTLTAYNSFGSNATTTIINVTPTPSPVITVSGTTLSVTGAYTAYQWVNGITPITGATNASYTYTASGTYAVVVDSAGCYGYSAAVALTLGAASFTTSGTTACQDSCITFTSTSTGTVDSIRWAATGGTITSPTSGITTICFPTAGTFTVTLHVFNSSGEDSSSVSIGVTPTPSPVITRTGTTLSVTGSYTAYQWLNGTTPITGATNASYIYTTSGTYSVIVDSSGCYGGASYSALGITNINATDNDFWLYAPDNNSIILHSASQPDEKIAVTMYDATGRIAITDTWPIGNITKPINTAFLPAGLYIIRLSNTNTATVLKWVKQ